MRTGDKGGFYGASARSALLLSGGKPSNARKGSLNSKNRSNSRKSPRSLSYRLRSEKHLVGCLIPQRSWHNRIGFGTRFLVSLPIA